MDANGTRYHVETPEQLKELRQYLKDGELDTVIRVWMAMKRREGKTNWDDAIRVIFSVKEDKKREAAVYRNSQNGSMVYCAELKYNLALKWCKQHLMQVTL